MESILQPAIAGDISNGFPSVGYNGESFRVVGVVRFVEDMNALALGAAANGGLIARLANNADWIGLAHFAPKRPSPGPQDATDRRMLPAAASVCHQCPLGQLHGGGCGPTNPLRL
jgi:hypothetical protein